MLPLDENLARRQVEEIDAKVLSNRKPPYPIAGGLFDALPIQGVMFFLQPMRRQELLPVCSKKPKE
jgi:hypothetical protein